MKILYIAHESGLLRDGSSQSLLQTMNYFQSKGNKLYLLMPKAVGKIDPQFSFYTEKIIIYYYRWWLKPETKSLKKLEIIVKELIYLLLIRPNLLKKLSDFVVKTKIDLIHTNNSVINIGYLLSLKTNVPHVWHFREYGKEDFDLVPYISKSVNGVISRLNHNNFLVFVSNSLKEKYENVLNNVRYDVIYNGVILDPVVSTNFSSNGINLLIAGRISESKGQQFAIDSVIELIEMGYDINLYVAGGGNAELLTYDNEKYKNNIHIMGLVQDMTKLRTMMDISIVCSKSEAFGRVTAESMSESIPVIGSNTGANTELIIDNYNGLLYEFGNSSDFNEKILNLYNKTNKLESMSINARKFAEGNFNINHNLQKVELIYKELVFNKESNLHSD